MSIDGGEDLEKLVGDRGTVLEALQELTRLAVQQETGARSRLMLDIAGWRADRREELTDLGTATAESVLESGESVRLQPMTPFERKVVHDAVAAVRGVHSESEGEEPRRRVVDLPRCLTADRRRLARPDVAAVRGPARRWRGGSPSSWSPPGSSAG